MTIQTASEGDVLMATGSGGVAVPWKFAEKIQAYARARDALGAVIAIETNEAYRRQLKFLQGFLQAGYSEALKQVGVVGSVVSEEPALDSAWEDNGYGHDVTVVRLFTERDIRRIEVVRKFSVGVSYGDDDSVSEITHLVMRLERFLRQYRPAGTPR